MHNETMETTKAILSGLARADSGEIRDLPVALDLYPEESLMVAAEAFASYCEVEIREAPELSSLSLSIRVREERTRESRKIIGNFLSFLLDHAARIRLRSDVER
jgi:hypothetical protein